MEKSTSAYEFNDVYWVCKVFTSFTKLYEVFEESLNVVWPAICCHNLKKLQNKVFKVWKHVKVSVWINKWTREITPWNQFM